ncbi:50S ribosomal protein L23 [Candidatus Pacearchaeota archaeon]|nr:50S ribosomal protein L23 [Candidatus Pacearchaeota archaeon]
MENKMILIKPITTEKAIREIELENKIYFVVEKKIKKADIKKEIEEQFNVKVEKVNTQIKNNQKVAVVKLKKEFKASDIAAKLGIM